MRGWKRWLLPLPIALVDAATFVNVGQAYGSFEEAVPPALVALTFVPMQCGSQRRLAVIAG